MIKIMTKEEMIKEYNLDRNAEYEMIPFSNWFIMEFGYVLIFDIFENDDERLDEKYAFITDEFPIGDVVKRVKDNGYYYQDGKVLKK